MTVVIVAAAATAVTSDSLAPGIPRGYYNWTVTLGPGDRVAQAIPVQGRRVSTITLPVERVDGTGVLRIVAGAEAEGIAASRVRRVRFADVPAGGSLTVDFEPLPFTDIVVVEVSLEPQSDGDRAVLWLTEAQAVPKGRLMVNGDLAAGNLVVSTSFPPVDVWRRTAARLRYGGGIALAALAVAYLMLIAVMIVRIGALPGGAPQPHHARD